MNCDCLLLFLQKNDSRVFFPAPRWGFFILRYDISLILSGKSDKITFSKSNFLPLKYGENTCFLKLWDICGILLRFFKISENNVEKLRIHAILNRSVDYFVKEQKMTVLKYITHPDIFD